MSYNKNLVLNKINSEMKFKFKDEEKKQFLINKVNEKDSSKQTVMLYMSVMRKVDKAEVDNDKEWHYFTKEEVDDALIGLMSKSIITLQSYVCIIKDYLVNCDPKTDIMLVGYAYTMKLTKDDLLNPAKGYLNKIGEKMQYVTDAEFDKMLECKASYSAKAMAILLFEGIKGDSYADLVGIRSEDVDVQNRLIYKEDGSVLYNIPDKYIDIFDKAISEKEYIECDYKGDVTNESTFSDNSQYLFKRTAYRLYDGTDPIDMNTVNKRIKAFGKAARNPHVTPTSILNSGLTLRLLKDCGYSEPNTVQLEEFRNKYTVKLSYTSMKTISKVLLEKLTSPSE